MLGRFGSCLRLRPAGQSCDPEAFDWTPILASTSPISTAATACNCKSSGRPMQQRRVERPGHRAADRRYRKLQ